MISLNAQFPFTPDHKSKTYIKFCIFRILIMMIFDVDALFPLVFMCLNTALDQFLTQQLIDQ